MPNLPDPITFRLRPASHAHDAALAAPYGVRTETALMLLIAGLVSGVVAWEIQHFNSLTHWQNWTAYLILPSIAATAAGTMLLAWPDNSIPLVFRRHGLVACSAAIAATTLAPFFIWWMRMPEFPYFTICAHVAMLAVAWMLFECTGWLHALFTARGRPWVAATAWFVQLLLYFGFLLIVVVVPLDYWTMIWQPSHAFPSSVMCIWQRIPEQFLHAIMLTPCLAMTILLVLAQILPSRVPQTDALARLSIEEIPQATPVEENEAP